MVLLTSGQVSLAVSSTIIFFFTLALFLAGYTIQQNTVRSLQIAIKPEPRTAHEYVYLPEKFASKKDSNGEQTEFQSSNLETSQNEQPDGGSSGAGEGKKAALLAEVLKGVADIHSNSQMQKTFRGDPHDQPPTFIDKNRAPSDNSQSPKENIKLEKLSKAERRKRIKMDIEEMTAEDRNSYKRRQW